MIDIKANLTIVEQQILNACEKCHRNKQDVTLLAVSKTKPIDLIEQAYRAGQLSFGESYIQESVEKIPALSHLPEIDWHFIGPIQSNKTQHISHYFSWVHSVDRIKIAKRLNEHRSSQDTPLNVCLQVNISGEESKSGVSIDELPALVDYVNQCEHLLLRGLMAIPEKNAAHSSYQTMQRLYKSLQVTQHEKLGAMAKIDTLSMGMSNDLEPAIAEGSTMVRIGTAIFGARSIKKPS